MEAHVELQLAEGSKKRLGFNADQVTLGSSPTAGLPLVNAAELMPEHVLLAPRKGGCWVSAAKGCDPPVELQGRTITGELVPWNSELKVGSLSITLRKGPPPGLTLLGATAEEAEAEGTSGKIRRAIAYSATLLFIAVLVFAFFFLGGRGDLDNRPPADAPELFRTNAPCPPGDPFYNAERLANEGASRMDRYPFDPTDGVLAVEAYDQAVSCYAEIEQPQTSAALRTLRDKVIARINDDYLVARLMLDRALEKENHQDALLAVQTLAPLVRHRSESPYTQWILLLEQRLLVAIEEARENQRKRR